MSGTNAPSGASAGSETAPSRSRRSTPDSSRPSLPGRIAARLVRRVREGLAWLPAAGAVFAACAAFWLLKRIGFVAGLEPALHVPVALVLLAALAPLRGIDAAPAFNALLRTVTVLFTFYAVAAYPAVSDHYLDASGWSAFLLGPARWLALAAGVLAWWRPGFALVPLLFVAWKKHLLAELLGFPLNATDYYPVAELGLFLVLGLGAARAASSSLARRAARPLRDLVARVPIDAFAATADGAGAPGTRQGVSDPPHAAGAAPSGWHPSEVVVVAALGIHLANYFWSAVEKMTLAGAAPWSWVLENRTHEIMLSATAAGLGPLLSHEPLHAAVVAQLAAHPVPGNLAVLLLQLAALGAFLRVRLAIALTLLYDLSHLAIFVTTSILFWKWMILNLGFVWALRRLAPRRTFPWPLAAIGVGLIVLAPLVFGVARLGWFDSASSNRVRVEALTADGREIAVPTTWFLEASAELAKSRLGQPFDGHFEAIGAFGKARDGYAQMRRANGCELEVAPTSGLADSFERQPTLETFFREHHAWMLSRLDADGHFPYGLFPHHNWSNPSLYREFAALDKRDVVAYRYTVDSVCLSERDGRLVEEVQLSGAHLIPLGPAPPGGSAAR